MAGVREPRRGARVRALAGTPPADRSASISAPRSAIPRGARPRFPWGEAAPDARHGNFDFAQWAPTPVGSHPDGASAWGVHDLIGDGWEWTDTAFEGFPGFSPMPRYPGYSADFFDGKHAVLKGASWATGASLIRPASATGSRRTTHTCSPSSAAPAGDARAQAVSERVHVARP